MSESVSNIPIGAMNVPLCFSDASIMIVKTSWPVKNISMNNPWATDVSALNLVPTLSSPGNMQDTSPAAAMPATICVMKSKAPRIQSRAPIRQRPRVTAGLKRPPEIRKKVQAFTAREKPVHSIS